MFVVWLNNVDVRIGFLEGSGTGAPPSTSQLRRLTGAQETVRDYYYIALMPLHFARFSIGICLVLLSSSSSPPVISHHHMIFYGDVRVRPGRQIMPARKTTFGNSAVGCKSITHGNLK